VSEPGKPGRPTVMDDRRKKTFIGLLQRGISEADAFRILCVDRKTVKSAMRADPEFSQGVKSAAATGKAELVKRIHGAEHWTAAAWLLERKYWQEYAQRRPENFTAEDVTGVMMQVAQATFAVSARYVDPARFDAFREELRRELNLCLSDLRAGRRKKARKKPPTPPPAAKAA
jgi:hypothetical protein